LEKRKTMTTRQVAHKGRGGRLLAAMAVVAGTMTQRCCVAVVKMKTSKKLWPLPIAVMRQLMR
jgi:hypothetical protein